ncbi:argonaute PAZ domain-containing protein [Chloracidobacterium validum]|uniref:Protein argonaute n=1 Tax=Chloracidobacterium validum TaxID=2821543 RepID=A0ABX8BGC8_9BACT|nr:argonaute PAZ domain-containing protein [Chloracidobacterium validum]QUW04140.1 argonaute PAZ domain-containing protein [Chloracidobacterium validum]
MNLNLGLTKTKVLLNRFKVKKLDRYDLKFHEYKCNFKNNPKLGDEQKAISRICYKLDKIAVRLGSKIITREEISQEKMKHEDWDLSKLTTRNLDCKNPEEQKGIEAFERKILEKELTNAFPSMKVERSPGHGLIWWIPGKEGIEKSGDGWEIHRGREVDIVLESDGNLYLEIDVHYRFFTPWTLHQWLAEYPDIPVRYVRNTYKSEKNDHISWIYEGISEKRPEEFMIPELNETLADYHRKLGATEGEINDSKVVLVRRMNDRKSKPIGHLSKRLSPSLTMEMLAQVLEKQASEKKTNKDVLQIIRKDIDSRLVSSKDTAAKILRKVYKIAAENQKIQICEVDGYILPKANLLAKDGNKVTKVAQVRQKGCVAKGEIKFGCLNLFNNAHKYPDEVKKCLQEVAKSSNVNIEIESYRTANDLSDIELERKDFWETWSEEGVKTVLVVLPWSSSEKKQKIRNEALQAGIATQFIVPTPKADKNKALNVVLGLLCKAGWQPVKLGGVNLPDMAELIIGFDVGSNQGLFYGASAFAVLTDGQSLGWELPSIQMGETFPDEAVWQVVSNLLFKFRESRGAYPKKLLLMRDGLVQRGEFEKTISELGKMKIAVDIIGVRKSGASRMGKKVSTQAGKETYCDADIGTVVFRQEEKSFTLITSQPIKSENRTIGSARPLKVVHEYGDTSLELLALQTYHLSQLHPASGFQSCRLPWVLHLADRSSKEFQRIGQISILHNIDRKKLIAV